MPTSAASARGASSRAVYCFVIVALATFLVGLAATRPPIKGYLASAIIEYEGPAAKEGRTSPAIPAAAAQATVRPIAHAPRQYLVSLMARDRETALTSLDAAVAQIVAAARVTQKMPDQAAIQQAASQLAEARRAAEWAWTKYAAWQTQLARHESRTSALPQVLAKPLPAESRPERKRTPNPLWTELNNALEELKSHRKLLLVSRTSAHPAVVDVTLRIAELERELAAVPHYLPTEDRTPPSVDERPAPAPVEAVAAAPPNTSERADVLLEGDRLRTAWEEARAAVSAAQEVHRQALEARVESVTQQARVMSPAEVVAISGGAPRPAWMTMLAVMAVAMGLVVTGSAVHTARAAVFETFEEISRTLRIPVVAVLATGEGAPRRRGFPVRAWLLKIAPRVAESALAGILLWSVYAAVTDPLVVRIATGSPVQAYALILERL